MKNFRRMTVGVLATVMVSASCLAAQAQPALQATLDTATEVAPAEDGLVDIQIVGGSVTKQNWPWMTYLSGCGSTLVAKRWVVTAAHCLKMEPFSIRIGSNNKFYGGEEAKHVSYHKHPMYGRKEGYDIGVFELDRDVRATPIPIAASAGPVGTRTKILGWGSEQPNGEGSSQLLKELDTSILPAQRCAGVDGDVNAPYEICTDSPSGQGACFGDSGGPQVKWNNNRWELIGATSRGAEICASAPSVYTNVSAHAKWLNQISRGAIPMPAGWVEPGPDAPVSPTPNPTTPQPTQPVPTTQPTTPQPTTPQPTTPQPTTPQPTQPNPNPGQNTFANNTPAQINDMQTVRSEITSTFASAKSVKVEIDMNHSCLQNLGLAITTPDGVRNVVKRAASSYRCQPWTGSKAETYPLNSQSDGRWLLEVSDEFRSNTGTLNRWSITFS